jgi:mono/diheme cytochrome c family protein
MSMRTWKFLSFGFLIVASVLLITLMAFAQQAPVARPTDQASASGGQVARGKYIVNEVAKCINCHTPRNAKGEIDRTQLLMGAPTFFQPAQAMPDWPQICPRIAGNPSATDEEFITLLMTGVWKFGKPLRDPMPQFHMTREDAEAVLAYLHSLR